MLVPGRSCPPASNARTGDVPDEAIGRAHGRNAVEGSASRLDEEPLAFHREIRQAFLRLAQAVPKRIRVVNAAGSEDEVFDRVIALIEAWQS